MDGARKSIGKHSVGLAALVFFAIQPCLFGVDPQQQTQDPKEQAVRARVETFYNLLIARDWTKAESLVTEGSKEGFRKQPKRPLASFEIQSIKLDNAGAAATVLVREQIIGNMASIYPLDQTTVWRLLPDGWYADVSKDYDNAPKATFSPLREGASRLTGTAASKDLKFKTDWYGLGKVRDGEVKVASFPFTNISNHVVTLADVTSGCECMRLKTQQKEYKPGESGVLEIEFDPSSLHVTIAQAFTGTVFVKDAPEGAITALTLSGRLLPHASQP